MKNNRLQFVISLLDKITKPIKRIQRSINRFTHSVRSNFISIGAAAVGIMASVASLDAMSAPFRDYNKSIGEVKSLGVIDADLNHLGNTAIKFSNEFGVGAAGIIGAAYDIQSSIDNLSGANLAKFTESSALLALATKSDTATITNYFGTMYGIFKTEANRIGKNKWIENLTGKTALAVQLFKTTGSQMSQAFTSLGANATSAGVNLSNQIAILGTLQATMSGSEAATKYKRFIEGAGKAQKALGLSFVDSKGKILPMIKILNKIKGKYGDLSRVADSDKVKNAFGTSEAVDLIKLLSKDIPGLSLNIKKINQSMGDKKARDMGNAIADSWDKAAQSFLNMRIIVGKAMQPMFEKFLTSVQNINKKIMRWSKMFPHLTKAVGYLAVGLIAIVAIFGVLAVVGGVTVLAIKPLLLIFKSLGMMLALLFSPFIKIVLVVAVLSYGAYKLYKNWNKVTTAFKNSTFGLTTLIIIEKMKIGFSELKNRFQVLWAVVRSITKPIFANDLNVIKSFLDMLNKVKTTLSSLKMPKLSLPDLSRLNPFSKNSVSDAARIKPSFINTGMGRDGLGFGTHVINDSTTHAITRIHEQQQQREQQAKNGFSGFKTGAGSMQSKTISSLINSNSTRGVTVENLNIQTNRDVDGQTLVDQLTAATVF